MCVGDALQARIKITGRKTTHLDVTDDASLMAESKRS